MGLIVSTLLALSAADALPARAVHYGRLAEGWARSRFVRPGMTPAQVRHILGTPDCVGGLSIADWHESYLGWHITVSYGLPDDHSWTHRVRTVEWYFRWEFGAPTLPRP